MVFFYTRALIVMSFFYTWLLLVMIFSCTWVLLMMTLLYTWVLLLFFFYSTDLLLHIGLDSVSPLLAPRWHRITGNLGKKAPFLIFGITHLIRGRPSTNQGSHIYFLALLLGRWSTLQTSPFLPSLSHAGKNVYISWLLHSIFQTRGEESRNILREGHFIQTGFISTPADSLIPADYFTNWSSPFFPSISYAEESCYILWLGLLSPLSRPTVLLCRPHPSCLQYQMRRRVIPITVYASNFSTFLLRP